MSYERVRYLYIFTNDIELRLEDPEDFFLVYGSYHRFNPFLCGEICNKLGVSWCHVVKLNKIVEFENININEPLINENLTQCLNVGYEPVTLYGGLISEI